MKSTFDTLCKSEIFFFNFKFNGVKYTSFSTEILIVEKFAKRLRIGRFLYRVHKIMTKFSVTLVRFSLINQVPLPTCITNA